MDLLCPELIGRDSERTQLSDALDLHSAGRTAAPLIIVGEAGIGKSRLVDWAKANSKCSFLSGGFAESPSRRRAVSEVAMAALRAGADLQSGELSLFRAALTDVLPGLGVGAEAAVDPVVTANALIELATATPSESPVIVIEDVHWADQDSLAVVDQLVQQSPMHGVQMLITARANESAAFDRLAERWYAARSATVIAMEPLTKGQVSEMVGACLGADPPEALTAAIVRDADGIPFFVEELLVSLRVSGTLTEDASGFVFIDGGRLSPPAAFTSQIDRRLRKLSDQDRETVVLAALTGPGIHEDMLRRCGVGINAIRTAIEECRRTGLVVDAERLPDPVSFRHALTRSAIVDACALDALRRIAGSALTYLDSAGIDDDVLALAADLARYAGDTPRRIALLVRLAEHATSRGSPAEALDHLDQARSEVHADQVWRRRIDAIRLEALGYAGELERARDLGRRLLPTLTATDDAETRRRCQLALARIDGASGAWSDAQAILDSITESPTAEELAFGAVVAMEQHDIEIAARRAEDARRAAIAAGSPTAECEAIEVIGRLARRRSYDEAAAVFEEGVRVAERHGLRLWRARGLFELGICDVTRFRDGAALHEAREAAIAAGSINVAIMADTLHATMVGNDFDRCDDAVELCDRPLTVARRIGLTTWEARLLVTQGQAHAAAGRPGEARGCAESALAAAPGDAEIEALAAGQCRGFAALVEGNSDEALRHYQHAFEALESLPYRTATMPWYDVALVGALWDPTGLGTAALEASRDPAIFPAVARWLPLADAVILGRDGDGQQATELVESTLTAAARMKHGGRRWGRVDMWMRYVSEAAVTDGWGHPLRWLVEAETGLIAVGAHPLARGCRAVLRRLGAAPRTRPDVAVPDDLAAMGVTRREVEVMGLLTQRLTNQQIADELHISPRTVKSHVEHLLTKTGRRNRTELAELAHLTGLPDRV